MVNVPIVDHTWCLMALGEVNKKVAACFKTEPVQVTFRFVNEITALKKTRGSSPVGLADLDSNEIQLVMCHGWQETAIHELIHFYRPMFGERDVQKITTQVVKYLRSFSQ